MCPEVTPFTAAQADLSPLTIDIVSLLMSALSEWQLYSTTLTHSVVAECVKHNTQGCRVCVKCGAKCYIVNIFLHKVNILFYFFFSFYVTVW